MYILDLNDPDQLIFHKITCKHSPKEKFVIVGKFSNYLNGFETAKRMVTTPNAVNGCEFCTPSCYISQKKEKEKCQNQ